MAWAPPAPSGGAVTQRPPCSPKSHRPLPMAGMALFRTFHTQGDTARGACPGSFPQPHVPRHFWVLPGASGQRPVGASFSPGLSLTPPWVLLDPLGCPSMWLCDKAPVARGWQVLIQPCLRSAPGRELQSRGARQTPRGCPTQRCASHTPPADGSPLGSLLHPPISDRRRGTGHSQFQALLPSWLPAELEQNQEPQPSQKSASCCTVRTWLGPAAQGDLCRDATEASLVFELLSSSLP